MNPKHRQDWIFNELMQDKNTTYLDMFTKYLQKFTNLSRQTFTLDWKKAQARAEKHHQAINDAIIKESIKLEKTIVKKAILSKHQALEILSEIAQGKAKRVEGQVVMPSPNEQTTAIKTMATLEGWEAPKKTELEITDVKPFFGSNPLLNNLNE